MTACLYCIHPATTTDKRGNPACEHCRDHVAPEMSDSVVTDLLRARELGEHVPMTDEERESIRQNIDDAMGNPVAKLEELIASLHPARP